MSLTDIAILWPIFTFWWWLEAKIRRAPGHRRSKQDTHQSEYSYD